MKTLTKHFSFARFEPAGFTKNSEIQIATSITDYIFRYLSQRFLENGELSNFGMGESANGKSRKNETETKALPGKTEEPIVYADSVCKNCGGIMVQTGSCKTCMQCGTSNGGC